MTPHQAAEQIETVINKSNVLLNKAVERTQYLAYDSILLELRKLELDADGYVLQSAENRKTIREVSKVFDRAVNKSGYNNGLSEFIKTISSIDAINTEYFIGIEKSFVRDQLFIKSLQKQTIAEIETLLLNDGLESQIKQPLLNILNQNVNTGGSYSGMVQQVKTYVIGNDEGEGKLLRYTKQIAQDALNNYSRAFQSATGEKLGLIFRAYVGGLMQETREFCRDRIDGYYHYLEIESWASLSWKGKRSDTTKSSIFIVCGGYNCNHQMLPVSTFVVPKDQLQRAEKLGFYQK